MEPVFFNRQFRIFLLLLFIFAQTHCLRGQTTAGFISLICGGNGTYEDPEVQGITWTSDEAFVYGGNIATVDPPSTGGSSLQFTSIRYFPGNQTKYCYSLPDVTPQSFYLVRASFWYGTRSIYETTTQSEIRFKLLVDADEWATISIPFPQENSLPLVQEIYVRALDTSISVCLAGKGIGLDTPFISAIEIRPLDADMFAIAMMLSTQCAIHKEYRLDLGAGSNGTVRYPNDSFDRIWDSRTAAQSLTTVDPVSNSLVDKPPVVVLQTAQGGDGLRSFYISLPVDAASHFYFYALYFAEIDPRVNSSGQRVFDVHVNSAPLETGFDLYSLTGGQNILEEVYRSSDSAFEASSSFNFSFQALANSSYGPLIGGLEVLRLSDTSQSNGTVAGDVLAINQIINNLGLKGWAGDPCLPYAYDWLNCSEPPFPVRITALLLSNRRLAGTIPPSINDLTELVQISLDQNNLRGSIPNLSELQNLRVLNLSNNSLSGTIPEFFSAMPNLQALLLENNNLSGQVPEVLLQRSNVSSFDLDVTGNPLLCKTACPPPSSHHKINKLALIAGLLAGFLILGCAVTCYLLVRARRSNIRSPPRRNVIRHTEVMEMSNSVHAFSYHDIEIATDNFKRKLGAGGFGPVYRGTLKSGVVAAIKVLSDASQQGAREFLNEVGILSQVRHKNLVRLVGYCIEQKLMLVYEYMSTGALSESLHGKGIPLDWRTRLSIALDAAQGLEYLHGGCSQPIIHRDVKSSNILLNERMEAKIADFGVSKLEASDTLPLASTAVVGSPGYVDPEYAIGMMVVTPQIDVYSFGVVLLEIISGQPPIYQTLHHQPAHIIDLVRELFRQGNIEEMVDNRIANAYNLSALWKTVELAMRCVDSNGNKRPTMVNVCIELREAIQMECQNEQFNSNTISGHSQASSGFHSITQVEAR